MNMFLNEVACELARSGLYSTCRTFGASSDYNKKVINIFIDNY